MLSARLATVSIFALLTGCHRDLSGPFCVENPNNAECLGTPDALADVAAEVEPDAGVGGDTAVAEDVGADSGMDVVGDVEADTTVGSDSAVAEDVGADSGMDVAADAVGGDVVETCIPLDKPTACGSRDCGTSSDGCGGIIACGTCPLPRTCGGGGVAGKCGGCSGALPGPTMAAIDDWCIDSTEVTQAQYKAFLSAKAEDLSGQPTICGANSSYAPVINGDCPAGTYSPDTVGTYPIRCVDWCDASAYCKWAGKRLCGAIGGGPLKVGDDPAKDQWYRACASAAKLKYPYGNAYVAGTCNTGGATTTVAVKSKSACTGAAPPLDSVFDMSGNVAEWIDSCGEISPGVLRCPIRGGFYGSLDVDAQCAYGATLAFEEAPPTQGGPGIGFRCCAF